MSIKIEKENHPALEIIDLSFIDKMRAEIIDVMLKHRLFHLHHNMQSELLTADNPEELFHILQRYESQIPEFYDINEM